MIHGAQRFTWRETYARCRRLASALARRGIGKNDTVAVMAPNIPAMYEAHFGVPMCGAVLNTLNTRLDAETIAFMLRHGGARALITDREFSATIEQALALLEQRPLVIDIDDPSYQGGKTLGEIGYEAFLAEGDPDYAWQGPADEWDAISLNYTSGTTGDPKGVVYHHRGAYLNAISNVLDWDMPTHAVYLWTLPMFHCNGWCFPWSMAERAGTSVCLRRVEAKAALDAIRDHRVTHMCGAPIVYSMLINAPEELRRGIDHKIAGQIAGAAPPAAIIEGAENIGIELTHVYGLTETYGPASVCAKHAAWSAMPIDQRAERNGRQGVRVPMQEALTVLDPETMAPVPWDGETMGEIMFRGNITMKGYLKNPEGNGCRVRRRLVPHRRSRGDAAGRLREDPRPLEGHHHLGRREHLVDRGRGDAVSPSRGAERRGRGAAGREVGRDAVRVHRAEARCQRDGGRTAGVLPRAHGALQGAEELRVPRAAEDLDREDPEVRAARSGEVGERDRVGAKQLSTRSVSAFASNGARTFVSLSK